MGTLHRLADRMTQAREESCFERWMNPPSSMPDDCGKEDPLDHLSGYSLVNFFREERRVEFIADGELRMRVSARVLGLPWYPGNEPDFEIVDQVHEALRSLLLSRAANDLYKAGLKGGDLQAVRVSRDILARLRPI